eukprot:9139726-Alexandrium_andersonii.AAC.1
MSCPTDEDWAALLRLAWYLLHWPRAVYYFPCQKGDQRVTVYADTDFAGCLTTPRSACGGATKWGSHMIKRWSTTQKTIAL